MVEKKKTPEWALDPFRRLLDHMQQAVQLLHLSIRGISVLRAMPQALQALAKAEPPPDATSAQMRLDFAKETAELAQTEVDTGFPLLHTLQTTERAEGLFR